MFDHSFSTQVVSKRFVILQKCLPLVTNLLKFLENNGNFISISQTILIYDFVITYLFILWSVTNNTLVFSGERLLLWQ